MRSAQVLIETDAGLALDDLAVQSLAQLPHPQALEVGIVPPLGLSQPPARFFLAFWP
jgi:hypothetical protein